ncbi:MAG: CDP-alcohol phosphatidyltransferase family protein [Hyphomicrobiales bacterium]
MSKFDRIEPDRAAREQRFRRFRLIPIRLIAPNLITLLALCSGVTAIRMATEERYELAVAAIIFAIILDALDGRVARLLKGTSRFGAELDSLADFVNFGVAPAIMIYLWSLQSLKSLGWIVCLGLAICCAARLARFNVALDDPDKPAWTAGFFTGVPAPAGAGIALLPMYLGFLGLIDGPSLAAAILLYTGFVGFLMVSRIPTFSGKGSGQRIRRDLVLPLMLITVLFVSLLLSYPWAMLTGLAVLYLCMLPVGVWRHQKLAAQHELDAAPEAEEQPVEEEVK